MIFLHALRSAEKKPLRIFHNTKYELCVVVLLLMFCFPFRKRQTRPTGCPMREQQRLVLFFGSSSCAGFTVLTVRKRNEALLCLFTPPPSLVYIFTSLMSFQPEPGPENEPSTAKVDEEAEQRETEKVSFVVVIPPPSSLSCFLYTFFTSLSSFQPEPGPENEPSTAKVDEEGE